MILAPVLDRVKVYGAIIIGATVVCLAGYGLLEFAQPVQAAPPAKVSEPSCTQFGIVGTVIIVRCVDEDDNVLFANSAGMLLSIGN